ncbi:hypothetical protein M1D34_31855 (plasmid) [Ensifer sp. D2-11]
MIKPRAISQSLWDARHQLRERFQTGAALRSFALAENFLDAKVLASIRQFAITSPMEHYGVHSPDPYGSTLEKGFGEPIPDRYYLTTHMRLRPPNTVPKELNDVVAGKDMLEFLGEVLGEELSGFEFPGTLTGWWPGDFIGEHCDEGDEDHPTKLVVSISLTEGWRPEYGGVTHFRWADGDEEITVVPQLNTAMLFAPGPHSVHWVTPVAAIAPVGRRFTWTLDYF